MNSRGFPLFSGENPLVWIEEMEDLFEDYNVPMGKFVDVAIPCLRGAAMAWGFYNAGRVLEMDWCAFSYNLLWEFDPSSKIQEEDESAVDRSDTGLRDLTVRDVEGPSLRCFNDCPIALTGYGKDWEEEKVSTPGVSLSIKLPVRPQVESGDVNQVEEIEAENVDNEGSETQCMTMVSSILVSQPAKVANVLQSRKKDIIQQVTDISDTDFCEFIDKNFNWKPGSLICIPFSLLSWKFTCRLEVAYVPFSRLPIVSSDQLYAQCFGTYPGDDLIKSLGEDEIRRMTLNSALSTASSTSFLSLHLYGFNILQRSEKAITYISNDLTVHFGVGCDRKTPTQELAELKVVLEAFSHLQISSIIKTFNYIIGLAGLYTGNRQFDVFYTIQEGGNDTAGVLVGRDIYMFICTYYNSWVLSMITNVTDMHTLGTKAVGWSLLEEQFGVTSQNLQTIEHVHVSLDLLDTDVNTFFRAFYAEVVATGTSSNKGGKFSSRMLLVSSVFLTSFKLQTTEKLHVPSSKAHLNLSSEARRFQQWVLIYTSVKSRLIRKPLTSGVVVLLEHDVLRPRVPLLFGEDHNQFHRYNQSVSSILKGVDRYRELTLGWSDVSEVVTVGELDSKDLSDVSKAANCIMNVKVFSSDVCLCTYVSVDPSGLHCWCPLQELIVAAVSIYIIESHLQEIPRVLSSADLLWFIQRLRIDIQVQRCSLEKTRECTGQLTICKVNIMKGIRFFDPGIGCAMASIFKVFVEFYGMHYFTVHIRFSKVVHGTAQVHSVQDLQRIKGIHALDLLVDVHVFIPIPQKESITKHGLTSDALKQGSMLTYYSSNSDNKSLFWSDIIVKVRTIGTLFYIHPGEACLTGAVEIFSTLIHDIFSSVKLVVMVSCEKSSARLLDSGVLFPRLKTWNHLFPGGTGGLNDCNSEVDFSVTAQVGYCYQNAQLCQGTGRARSCVVCHYVVTVLFLCTSRLSTSSVESALLWYIQMGHIPTHLEAMLTDSAAAKDRFWSVKLARDHYSDRNIVDNSYTWITIATYKYGQLICIPQSCGCYIASKDMTATPGLDLIQSATWWSFPRVMEAVHPQGGGYYNYTGGTCVQFLWRHHLLVEDSPVVGTYIREAAGLDYSFRTDLHRHDFQLLGKWWYGINVGLENAGAVTSMNSVARLCILEASSLSLCILDYDPGGNTNIVSVYSHDFGYGDISVGRVAWPVRNVHPLPDATHIAALFLAVHTLTLPQASVFARYFYALSSYMCKAASTATSFHLAANIHDPGSTVHICSKGFSCPVDSGILQVVMFSHVFTDALTFSQLSTENSTYLSIYARRVSIIYGCCPCGALLNIVSHNKSRLLRCIIDDVILQVNARINSSERIRIGFDVGKINAGVCAWVWEITPHIFL